MAATTRFTPTYKDGKPKEHGKYLEPPDRKNMIYFVPGTSHDLVKAVGTPVIVTESELSWEFLLDAACRLETGG
ncbi:MAG: hypothetical protein ABSG56_24430 [Bryobacteraceae bacterium]|jgi:hypothetical protein